MSFLKKRPADRYSTAFLCLCASALLLVTAFGPAVTMRAEELPDSVADVVIEGNETIPASVILQKILTQPGRPLTNRQLREDKRNLMATRWFYSVAERFDQGPKGTVLIFRVHERPIVRRVSFLGMHKIKQKELASWTGLKVGSPFDHVANREAVHRIEQECRERGFYFVKVTLEKGGQPSDREVVIRIQEGPKVRVQDRKVEFLDKNGKVLPTPPFFLDRRSQDGSVGLSPSAARLKTKLQTKEAMFGILGGLYKPESMEQDITALKQYYRGLGFFDIQVKAEPLFTKDRSSVQIKYTVNEGVPYKVRDIKVSGNQVIPVEKLRAGAQLQKGQYFNSLPLGKDVRSMLAQYGERGHYFAEIVPVPQFTEEPGIVDIVLEIDEDRPRYVRNINVHLEGDHPHTKEVVPINQLQIEPGDLANPALIARGRSRAQGSGILENVQMQVVPVDPGQTMNASMSRSFRGQSGIGYAPAWTQVLEDTGHSTRSAQPVNPGHEFPHTQTNLPAAQETKADNQVASESPAPAMSFIHRPDTPAVVNYAACKPSNLFYQPQQSLLVSSFPEDLNVTDDFVVRGQNPPYGAPVPERGDAMLRDSPYKNQFLALPPGWVDINVSAAEGRTGRLMFGAGVNSNAGVVGSFVWDESNFDLFRPPRSFGDIIDGRAWRGGGQRFRLEAAPGAQVSRYALSWTDPYFMYSDYSLGVSGFYFNRFYPDWDETRLGGRVTLGKQLTPEWSVSSSLRLEDVEITNPRLVAGTTMSVPELEAVKGSNFLSTIGGSVAHDTRDSTLLPGAGHFGEFAFEQAFGDFDYSRLEGEARQYFTLHNRPDGSGAQVLTLAGVLGWSSNSTPIFERYYAGGFQSFRGFRFRGITPRGADNIATGGTWQMLGTAEYRMPVTADDMINVVAFSDFGTVDQDVTLENFRVTVGLGLRVVVPAMGPVPLAFDFGIPLRSRPGDNEQIFSFYVGVNR